MRNVHDNNPLPSIAYKRWKAMTWQEAVEEASVLMHLAVQLDEVRKREQELELELRK
jgi:hypothetical protein